MKSHNCVLYALVTILLLLAFVACSSEPSETSELSIPDKPQIKTEVWLIPDSDTSAVLSGQTEEALIINPSTVYIYDRNGHQIMEDWFPAYDAEWSFEYDDKGNVLKYERLDSDGSLALSDEYQYDDAGNVIKATGRAQVPIQIDNDSIEYFEATRFYKYDDDGNWLELELPEDDTFLIQILHKYDKDGNEIEESNIGSVPSPSATTAFEYDEEGNLIQRSQYYLQNGLKVPISLTKYEYSESGNKVEITEYLSDTSSPNSKTIVTYNEFDEHGNWTKLTGSTEVLPEGDKLPAYMRYREFTYY